jgi:hypothetical protein
MRIEVPEVFPHMIPTAEPEVPALDAEVSDNIVVEPHMTNIMRPPPQWFEKEVFILS